MGWKDGLTEEQRNAASHAGQHARLLAGPGTGKTFTLTRRIIRLFVELKKPAESILAFTFTKFAAAELRRRVAAEVGVPSKKLKLPRISTLYTRVLFENYCVTRAEPNYPNPSESLTIGKRNVLSSKRCRH